MLGLKTTLLICVVGIYTSCYASLDVYRTGWLDRVVAYFKDAFVQDASSIAPIKIQTSIITAPPGYVDSEGWNERSVLRLLNLIRQSDTPTPVRRVLRQAFQEIGIETRRMSVKKTYQLFPSLKKELSNDFYYDSSDNEAALSVELDTRIGGTVLFISNPVEARLPSSWISVGLLKTIMLERAKAARSMAPTTIKKESKFNRIFPKDNQSKADSGNAGNTTAGKEAATVGNGTNAINGTLANYETNPANETATDVPTTGTLELLKS